jgi:hypothetical protein
MVEQVKNYQEERFEFLLRINGNIVCQRLFPIRGYNVKSNNSLELFNMANECVNIIKSDMESKTRDYLWKYYNPYEPQKLEEIDRRNIYEKIDNFQFEVRVDKKTIVKREFSGNPYPPKVRYQADIRDIVHEIIGTIRHYLQRDKYTFKYENIDIVDTII